MNDLSCIKVLVWDLDGTLYQSMPEFSEAMHGAFIKILSEHKNLSFEAASQLLEETRKIYKGTTKSLEALGCGDKLSIIEKVETLVNKAAFLKVDPKIQHLFTELASFRHVLLSDTTRKTIIKELEAIGLSSSIFELIVGVDETKTTKPDLAFFKAVLAQTKLPAQAHLMIGDRIEVDLIPARQLGMKTCLVWSGNAYEEIDFSLPSVYDVLKLFNLPSQTRGELL